MKSNKKLFYALLMAMFVTLFMGPRGLAQANTLPAMKIMDARQNKIDAALQNHLSQLQAGDTLTVIVTLRQQADLSRVVSSIRADRQQGVIRALQATADATQNRLKKFLADRQSQGSVSNYSSFWIFNGFSVTANSATINELAQQADVFSITPDEIQIVPALGPAEPNITLVNAPAVWNLGDTGQGVVVASLDSGVDINHPDLSVRWRGGSNSWFDPYGQHPTTPTDLTGHGTQTMGIMVGGDAGGTTIGVAPGAKWIAAKIFKDDNSSTATAIHQSYQWLLNPDGNPSTADAPQVANNSWDFANPGCDLTFEPDLESLRAAGILPVFAAGNSGPSSSSNLSPANNPAAFAVGAIGNNSQIYAYSGRGPSSCLGYTGPFPQLVAPGVNVNTSDRFGLYGSYTGTSFSAPHAAGALALLLAAYPNLSAADQQAALINTAVDLGTAGPDNVFGYGRLDILAAYNWFAAHPTSTPAPTNTFTPSPTATATFTPTSAPATQSHIGDLDRASTLSGTKWNATVTIYVHDSNHKLVANAAVTGQWSNGGTGTGSCTTNSSGACTVSKTGLSTKTTSITFSMTGISATGLIYTSSANHDPDTDSNGTTIVVSKP